MQYKWWIVQLNEFGDILFIPTEWLNLQIDKKSPSTGDDINKPSPDEQLQRVYDVLRTTLPELFIKPMDYSVYNPNLVFENNIRGMTTV